MSASLSHSSSGCFAESVLTESASGFATAFFLASLRFRFSSALRFFSRSRSVFSNVFRLLPMLILPIDVRYRIEFALDPMDPGYKKKTVATQWQHYRSVHANEKMDSLSKWLIPVR